MYYRYHISFPPSTNALHLFFFTDIVIYIFRDLIIGKIRQSNLYWATNMRQRATNAARYNEAYQRANIGNNNNNINNNNINAASKCGDNNEHHLNK